MNQLRTDGLHPATFVFCSQFATDHVEGHALVVTTPGQHADQAPRHLHIVAVCQPLPAQFGPYQLLGPLPLGAGVDAGECIIDERVVDTLVSQFDGQRTLAFAGMGPAERTHCSAKSASSTKPTTASRSSTRVVTSSG